MVYFRQSKLLRFVVALIMLWACGMILAKGHILTQTIPNRLALVSMVMALLVVGWRVNQHATRPDHAPDKWLCIMVVAMVPIYAVCSTVKLLIPGPEHHWHRQSLEAAKEIYEAVVLHDFLELMYHC